MSTDLKRLRELATTLRDDYGLKGPWGWFGNVRAGSPYLATAHHVRFVLGAGRRHDHVTYTEDYDDIERTTTPDWSDCNGAHGSCELRDEPDSETRTHARDTPTFTFPVRRGDGHSEMQDAHEIAVYEVAPTATREDDRRVYRHDVVGFRSPVADYLAAVDAETVLALLDRVNELERALAEHAPAEVSS